MVGRDGDAARALLARLREQGAEALWVHDADAAIAALEGEDDRRGWLEALAGGSRAIRRVREQIAQVAPMRATVLIEGEEGTGKSVVAHALHRRSGRADGPFVRFECGAVPAELVEAELCGTERPDEPPRPGRLELADGGTLVLDRVEQLPARAQLRLLRVLQDRAFERVGGSRTRHADVRVLATTTADLEAAQREGAFRQDLFRLLAVVRVALPPLRERREDLPVLAERLLRDLAREHGRRLQRLTRGVLDRLLAYDWPGNVAELERVLEALVVAAPGRAPLDVSSLPAPLRGPERAARRLEIEVGMTIEEAERALIEATLRRTAGDKRRAAEMLAIGLRTLYRKLDRYGGR